MVGIVGGEVDVVHHRDQGAPLLVAEAADRLHQLHRVLHVEVVEGFVEQQAVGLLGDGHGEVGQLPLPAAQLVEVGPAQGGEGEKVDGLVDRDAVFPGQVALAVGKRPKATSSSTVSRSPTSGDWRRVATRLA